MKTSFLVMKQSHTRVHKTATIAKFALVAAGLLPVAGGCSSTKEAAPKQVVRSAEEIKADPSMSPEAKRKMLGANPKTAGEVANVK
jgi:hypothetical protein